MTASVCHKNGAAPGSRPRGAAAARGRARRPAPVVLAAPMLVIAMKIRSGSPGPVIYAQNRVTGAS